MTHPESSDHSAESGGLTTAERELLEVATALFGWATAAEALGATTKAVERIVAERVDAVIDAIEETFLAHLPSKAISYCAQEDVNTGLDALRERFLGRDDR